MIWDCSYNWRSKHAAVNLYLCGGSEGKEDKWLLVEKEMSTKNIWIFIQREFKAHSNASVLKEYWFLSQEGQNCSFKQAKCEFPGWFWGFLGKSVQILPPNVQSIEIHFIGVKTVPTKKFKSVQTWEYANYWGAIYRGLTVLLLFNRKTSGINWQKLIQ